MRPYGRPRRLAAAALASGLLLTGCSSADTDTWRRGGMPEGVTDQTDRITALWTGSWVAAIVVGALVWGLIFWSVVVFRRKPTDTGLPPQVRYNLPIEVLYTAVPLVVVLIFFFFTARDEREIVRVADSTDHVVNVVGKRWSWDFNYADSQGEPLVYQAGTQGEPPMLYLPQGESVRFVLETRDVNHSFWVPAFLFKLDLIAGRVNEFVVTPTKLGTFAGKCAELCGQDHARMLFNVSVVTPEDYQQELDRLEAAGQVGELSVDLGPDRKPDADSPQGENGSDR